MFVLKCSQQMATETKKAWTPSFASCLLNAEMLQMIFKWETLDNIMLNVSSAVKVVAQFNDWLGENNPGTLFISKHFPQLGFWISAFAILTTTQAFYHPFCNIYLNNYKLSSLGFSQLPGYSRLYQGWRWGVGGSDDGCSVNNSPSHEQTPWGARPPSRPPSPREHKYILP